jgi:hypothetical protein
MIPTLELSYHERTSLRSVNQNFVLSFVLLAFFHSGPLLITVFSLSGMCAKKQIRFLVRNM